MWITKTLTVKTKQHYIDKQLVWFSLRFYAVTSRRYNTLSRCNNSISRTVKHQQQQQQQQFERNDKPTSQFSAHMHADNGDVTATATATGRQYFVLGPDQL